MRQKQTFKIIFASIAILLILLPPFAALNSFLTHSLDRSGWYRPIQDFVVPWDARLVAVAISPLGIQSKLTPGSALSSFYMVKDGAIFPVDLAWNCLGWQSALLLIVSAVAGLRGKFTYMSRFKCIIFGFLGTVLINIFRMGLIAVLIYYVNSFAAMIVHDYLTAFITLLWLLFFWWFSYSFVLEEKLPTMQEKVGKV